MTSPQTALDAGTVAKIDGLTQMLLAQLEVQTWAALVLLERAPPEQRDAFLAQLAELRGQPCGCGEAWSGRPPRHS